MEPIDFAAAAQAIYGPQAEEPTEQTGSDVARALYGNGPAVPPHLHDGSIASTLAHTLQDAVADGHAEIAEAHAFGRALTAEARAIGFDGFEADRLFRELDAQTDARTARVARGEAVAWLRSEFGERAEERLQAAVAWMRERAPNLAQALAASGAGNDLEVVRTVVRAHLRAQAQR